MRVFMHSSTALLLVTVVSGAFAGPEPGRYEIDTAHSSVTFTVGHAGVSRVTGRLDGISGAFVISEHGIDGVSASLDPASVYTGHEKRDQHLRSDDFFGVDQHPMMKFVATEVRRTGDGHYAVDGELTLLGVTRPVSFEAGEVASKSGTYQGKTYHMVGYVGEGKLDRSSFGMDFALGPVSDRVDYRIHIEAIQLEADEADAP